MMTTEEQLRRYKEILLAWNEKINLIGPEAVRNVDEHITEAVAAASILEPERETLDFGSGGGLPAVPMAIMSPAARFHLVESDQKKWAFLKHVVRECGLNSQVHGDRLARVLTLFPPELRFSLVVSRAVGNPEQWVPLLKDRLETSGLVALFQGTPDVPEIAGFKKRDVIRLPRGESNYLITLIVPRGTT
jgi:16S rRNA (guanine527-N7)-methyltransferase